MTSPRNLLLIALLFLGYLLWNAWQEDYVHAPPPSTAETPAAASPGVASAPAAPANGEVPSASTSPASTSSTSPATPTATTPANAAAPRVTVTTDVLRVEIDTRGGSIVTADLLAYPQQPKDFAHPVRLLDDSASHFFEAQSGLVSAQAAPDHTATFAAEKNEYTLADGADSVEVPLTWTDPSGVSVRKVFVFKRASYAIEQRQEIANKGSTSWTGNA
ncbi:MAG TPA: membrane protein insertase YidC, partial [Rhodanobacteraceae bacterium]